MKQRTVHLKLTFTLSTICLEDNNGWAQSYNPLVSRGPGHRGMKSSSTNVASRCLKDPHLAERQVSEVRVKVAGLLFHSTVQGTRDCPIQ
jgi:hypothetical protein